MEQKTERSASRKFAYLIIILFVFLLLIEGLLSMLLYQKIGPEKFASVEALKAIKTALIPARHSFPVKNHLLARPEASEETNHDIAEESIESRNFIYESWVEFRNMDYSGKYLNTSGAVRKSSPAEYINAASRDTVDVYFFGGSTMFGFNVQDNETIPAQFVNLYKNQFPQGKSLRVFNYGMPYYYSYQELVLLSDLIFNGHRPSVIIFLDGINDFWFAGASYYRQSYFSYIFRQVFSMGLRSKGEFRFVDTADAMYKDPTNMPREAYNNGLVANYIENMKNAAMIADLSGASIHFFCEPSPFYKYPNQQKDPVCLKDTTTRFSDIYPMLENKADSLPDFTFLGSMLQNEQGYPFIDGFHYSPQFTKKIAAEILRKVQHDLNSSTVSP